VRAIHLAVATPLRAFACALLICTLYFVVVFGALSALPPGSKHLSATTYLLMLAIPALASAAVLTMGPRTSRSRSLVAIQAVSAAVIAPLVVWYAVGFAFVIATGEGF